MNVVYNNETDWVQLILADGTAVNWLPGNQSVIDFAANYKTLADWYNTGNGTKTLTDLGNAIRFGFVGGVSSANTSCIFMCNDKINLSKFSKLEYVYLAEIDSYGAIGLYSDRDSGQILLKQISVVSGGASENGTIDISNYTGEYYVGLTFNSFGGRSRYVQFSTFRLTN